MTPQPNKSEQPENKYGIETLLMIVSFLSSIVKNVIMSFSLFALMQLLPNLVSLITKWRDIANEAGDLNRQEWAQLGAAFVQEFLPLLSSETVTKLIAGTRSVDAKAHWLEGFIHIAPAKRGLGDPFSPASYSENELAAIGQGFIEQITALGQQYEQTPINPVLEYLLNIPTFNEKGEELTSFVGVFIYEKDERETSSTQQFGMTTREVIGTLQSAQLVVQQDYLK